MVWRALEFGLNYGEEPFRLGTTWTTVSSARVNMRLNPEGFIFEGKGSACFPHDTLVPLHS